ncbi:hypothetical protein [Thiorhodospira sibirica]|uniref:hypothetical protein n=1 Tax=Thiorhodospira sibirica TaxID=154347 RepID=UPI00022C17E1|nr:hypothetical protein [Thiorhodospira sibirica]
MLAKLDQTQLIEVVNNPDSAFAFRTYSRYEARAQDIQPISLQKLSFNEGTAEAVP